MATREPGRAAPSGSLTPMPRVEDLPVAEKGFDQDRVREAFDAFRRHAVQLQAQLRVLQAAGTTSHVEPTGHAVRMDSLHLIRAAAEFADALERDAQTASAAQIRKTQEDVRRRQREAQAREQEVERYRKDSEEQRAAIMAAARTEARELLAAANRDATRELQEAESRGTRLLEQSRHQATELTNSARAEVEQTLEWARAQASAIMGRAQEGAQQFLAAAGLGNKQMASVIEAILKTAAADISDDPRSIRKPEAEPSIREVPPSEPPAGAPGPGADRETGPQARSVSEVEGPKEEPADAAPQGPAANAEAPPDESA